MVHRPLRGGRGGVPYRRSTMQPDFYHSLINLGKIYLARGQLDKGLDILEKVRDQVAGSELEKRIDREIIIDLPRRGPRRASWTGMSAHLHRALSRGPIEPASTAAIRLAYTGQLRRRPGRHGFVPDRPGAKRRVLSGRRRYRVNVGRRRRSSTTPSSPTCAGDHAAAAAVWAAVIDLPQVRRAPDHELVYRALPPGGRAARPPAAERPWKSSNDRC